MINQTNIQTNKSSYAQPSAEEIQLPMEKTLCTSSEGEANNENVNEITGEW